MFLFIPNNLNAVQKKNKTQIEVKVEIGQSTIRLIIKIRIRLLRLAKGTKMMIIGQKHSYVIIVGYEYS